MCSSCRSPVILEARSHISWAGLGSSTSAPCPLVCPTPFPQLRRRAVLPPQGRPSRVRFLLQLLPHLPAANPPYRSYVHSDPRLTRPCYETPYCVSCVYLAKVRHGRLAPCSMTKTHVCPTPSPQLRRRAALLPQGRAAQAQPRAGALLHGPGLLAHRCVPWNHVRVLGVQVARKAPPHATSHRHCSAFLAGATCKGSVTWYCLPPGPPCLLPVNGSCMNCNDHTLQARGQAKLSCLRRPPIPQPRPISSVTPTLATPFRPPGAWPDTELSHSRRAWQQLLNTKETKCYRV